MMTMMMRQAIVSFLVLLCISELSQAFTCSHRVSNPSSSSSSTSRTWMTKNGKDGDNKDADIPREEEMIGSPAYESSVDWDAEWKKVVRDQKRGVLPQNNKNKPRPGDGYYKSEAEIKAIQAANKAAFEAQKVKASLPSWQMLKGDWKVCSVGAVDCYMFACLPLLLLFLHEESVRQNY
mmetsp:Transcript_19988/g.37902  ORF Transcript_19988/g.37902 Transcript_19988/m.37902 type:complete len:179 (-) Transcript_19988:484-1020(-)